MQRVVRVLVVLALSVPLVGVAKGSGGGHGHGGHGGTGITSHGGSHGSHGATKNSLAPGGQAAASHKSTYANGVTRDAHGRIARSSKAKDDFKKSQPCPSTGKSSGACPGYVIDHVKPLKRGGADAPSNMQWQTTKAAKEKDRTE